MKDDPADNVSSSKFLGEAKIDASRFVSFPHSGGYATIVGLAPFFPKKAKMRSQGAIFRGDLCHIKSEKKLKNMDFLIAYLEVMRHN
jgi:hypothetical protein